MATYKFYTDQFGFTDSEFHVLRSKTPVRKFQITGEVSAIELGKGRQVANWLLLLIVGALMFAGSVIYFSNLVLNLDQDEAGPALDWIFVFPLFTFLIGAACVAYSFKNGMILKVSTPVRVYSFPLERLIKSDQWDRLIWFLKSNPAINEKVNWGGMKEGQG